MVNVIQIGSRSYPEKSRGKFVIPFSELATLTFNEVPYYSTVEVHPLPISSTFLNMSISATHAGGPGPGSEEFSLSVKIQFVVQGTPENSVATDKCFRLKKYVRRALESIAGELGFHTGPDWTPFLYADGELHCIEAFYRDFRRQDNPVLAHCIAPFLQQYTKLATLKDTLVFLCHASEDKPFVASLCAFLDTSEVGVWYDRREIKVGDSIVQRISDGIGSASHLVIVLSKASVAKPWVRREMSSALMRQLQDSSIRILPLLIEDCEIPPLLADIRYADCRKDQHQGFRELVAAVT